MVQEHNRASATAWGYGGAGYDFISFGLSDALGHAVQVLWPEPNERVLDVATGTGWTARLAAQLGAKVSAVDIADELLAAAKSLSEHTQNAPNFQHGDAESLPFEAASFDAVISTFGVMFAGRPDAAARELARVTRPGGRLVLLTWLDDPDGYIPKFFQLVSAFSDAPPPETSPLAWGNETWVTELLRHSFDVTCVPHRTTLFAPDFKALWKKYLMGFGPMALAARSLKPERLKEFRLAFEDLHTPYRTETGLRIDRNALMIRGTRR